VSCNIGLIILQRAINSRLGRAENARFLERFRYTIVASQLLSIHSYLGQVIPSQSRESSAPSPHQSQVGPFTLGGAAVTASVAFGLAWLVHWARNGADSIAGKSRVAVLFAVLVGIFLISYAYMRRQWLHYLRQEALSATSDFVATALQFDQVVTGSLSLVQEVELVSRGYRM
jgi:hypothetical protein